MAKLNRLGWRKRLAMLVAISFAGGIATQIWTARLDARRGAISPTPPPRLHVLTYKNFFPTEMRERLSRDLALEIRWTEAENPEDLWEKLGKTSQPRPALPTASSTAFEPFDIVTLFSYQTLLAAQLGWTKPFQSALLSHFNNVSPDFNNLRTTTGGIPLLWGMNGLLVNAERVADMTSWADVLKTAKLKGKVGLPSSTVELFRLSQIERKSPVVELPRRKPKAPLSIGPPVVRPLAKDLQPWFAQAKISADFMSVTSLFGAPNAPDVVLASRAESAFAPLNRGNWRFISPAERATFWVLSVNLSRETRSGEKAHRFADALLENKNSLALALAARQASTNRALETDVNLDGRLKPSALRTFPLDSFVLWQDFSRAREVRAAIDDMRQIDDSDAGDGR